MLRIIKQNISKTFRCILRDYCLNSLSILTCGDYMYRWQKIIVKMKLKSDVSMKGHWKIVAQIRYYGSCILLSLKKDMIAQLRFYGKLLTGLRKRLTEMGIYNLKFGSISRNHCFLLIRELWSHLAKYMMRRELRSKSKEWIC